MSATPTLRPSLDGGLGDAGNAERVKLLYEISPPGYLASLAVAVLATVALFDHVAREPLLAWLVAVVAINVGRFALFKAWQRRAPPAGEAVRWERYFSAGAFAMGCAWGALAVGFFPEQGFGQQLVVIFIAAVMAMGGMGTLTPSRLAWWLFAAPIVLGVVPRTLLMGDPTFLALGALEVFYVVLLFKMFGEFHRTLATSIQIRGEQHALIGRLRHAEDLLIDALESVPEAIALYDADDRLIMCNRAYVRAQTPFTEPGDIVGRSFVDLVRMAVAMGESIEPEFAGDVEAWVAERVRRRRAQEAGVPRMYRIADGRWMQTKINRTRHGGLVAVRSDITRLRDVEASLQAALAEEQLVLDTATVGIAFLKDRKIVKCNRQMEAMLGYGHGALIGQSSSVYFPSVEAWERVGEEVYSAMERGEHGELDLELMRKDGTRLWCHAAGRPLESGAPAKGAIWVYSDITERRRHEELNRELADQDVLTGLANRRVLDDRLSQAIAQARRAGTKVVLMLVDLDHFKVINDRYGHHVGDQVLKTVASRLQGCVRAADTTARTGGDEFVVVLSAVAEPREAARVAGSALTALARPVAVDGIEHVLGASIGISVFPDDGDDPESLLRFADQAMYGVKASGGNGYRFHCDSRASG